MINSILSILIGFGFIKNDISFLPASSSFIPNAETNRIQKNIPKKNSHNIEPVIQAKAAIAIDMKSGLILYGKNINNPLPIASISKLMTGIIILEENTPDEIVTISKNAAKTGGSEAGLIAGEKMTIENLLYALLLPSGNDAAVALAEHNSQNIKNFVKKMNKKSRLIGLNSTSFINPTGLDEKNSISKIKNTNLSSAYDLGILAQYAYKKKFIQDTVKKKTYEIYSTDKKIRHQLVNKNELLKSYFKVLGLKTGTTEQAGECLAAIIENNGGNSILTIVLNSPNRYNESKILADWVFRSYNW